MARYPITIAGSTVRLAPQVREFATALVKAMPEPVWEDELIAATWGDYPPKDRLNAVSRMKYELGKCLPKHIKVVRVFPGWLALRVEENNFISCEPRRSREVA